MVALSLRFVYIRLGVVILVLLVVFGVKLLLGYLLCLLAMVCIMSVVCLIDDSLMILLVFVLFLVNGFVAGLVGLCGFVVLLSCFGLCYCLLF